MAEAIIHNYSVIEHMNTTAHAAGEWSLLLEKVSYKGTFVLRGNEIIRVTPAPPAVIEVIDLTVDTDDEDGHVRLSTPEREDETQPLVAANASAALRCAACTS